MTEPYTNTRPMKNTRRLLSWVVGVVFGLTWCIGPVMCILSISAIELIPIEYRQQVVQNLQAIPIWVWLVISFLIVTGFVAGRDLVNWLYKE